MAIQRWDPLRDLMDLQERMKQLFSEALSRSAGSPGGDGSGGWKPPMDLFEESDRYVLRADLPGVAAKDVEVQVENGMLVLRGERKVDANVSRESYLRIERPHGSFSASVSLPAFGRCEGDPCGPPQRGGRDRAAQAEGSSAEPDRGLCRIAFDPPTRAPMPARPADENGVIP